MAPKMVNWTEDLISLQDAAALAGYSRTSMYNFIRDKSVAAKRFGTEWICYRPDVIKLRENRTKSAAGRPPNNEPVDIELSPQDPAPAGEIQVRRTALVKRKKASSKKTKGDSGSR